MTAKRRSRNAQPRWESGVADAPPAAAPFSDVERIRRGFSWEVAGKLQEELGLKDKVFAAFLGVSGRTLARRRSGQGALDATASDRLYRIMRVVKLAAEVFENEGLGLQWLRRPQIGLGNAVPLTLLDTEPGFEAVETLLQRIEYGVVA